MEIFLETISPIAFELVRPGNQVKIVNKKPNRKEFRGTLESAQDCFLIMKGVSKIGMIPLKFNQIIKNGNLKNTKIHRLDALNNIITIDLQ